MTERSANDGRVGEQWQRDLCRDYMDPRLGDANAGTGLAATVALSWFVTSQEKAPVNRLSHRLADMARAAVRHNGEVLPGGLPDLPARGYSDFASCMSRAGISSISDLRKLAEDDPDGLERLPADVLTHFFAPEIIRVAALAIQEGPGLASLRATRACSLRAHGEVPGTKRSSSAQPKITQGTINNYVSAIWTLFDRVKKLRDSRKIVGCRSLEAWDAVPPKPDIEAAESEWDLTSVPLALLRLAIRSAYDQLMQTLGVRDGEDPVEVARSRGATRRGIRLSARNVAILALLGVLGCRAGAIAELTVGSYRRARKVSGTSTVQPAMRIRPQKMTKTRYKALPGMVAQILDVWLIVYERWVGRPLRPNDPLFPSSKGVSKQRGLRPRGINRGDVTSLCSGHPNPDRTGGTYPRLPRDPNFVEMWARRSRLDRSVVPADSFDGYNPHAVRHTVSEVICSSLGVRWLKQNGHEHLTAALVSDGLLDHKIGKDAHGYKNWSTEPGREELSALGTAIMGDAIFTDFGAGKRLDQDAVAERDQILAGIAQRLGEVERQQRENESALSQGDIRAIGRAEVLRANRERLREQQDVCVSRRAALFEDPTKFLIVDDLEAAIEGVAPFPRLTTTDVPEEPQVVPETVRRVRDSWLCLPEYCKVSGFPESSLRKLVNGTYAGRLRDLPFRPGDTSAFQRLNGKTTIIFVDRTNPALLDTPEKQELLESMLSTLPPGRAWADPNGKRARIRRPPLPVAAAA